MKSNFIVKYILRSLCSGTVAVVAATHIHGSENVFRVDVSKFEEDAIGNRFSNVSLWHYNGTSADETFFHQDAESMPENWLRDTYPWLEEAQVYIASGGGYKGHSRMEIDTAGSELDRDLFKNPGDRTVLDDYDFSPLVRACRNMLRQGIKPCLKLHNVPVKYSKNPKIDWFRVNVRPPDDYQVYADYIAALVTAMVDAFSIDEVGQWRWYIGTEFDNKTWFQANDETPESTAIEFLKLYDYSVFALEQVLGEYCGPVGSHAMMVNNGYWEPELFFAHCAEGVNYATGQCGSRLDFFAVSQYDLSAVDLTYVKEYWPELQGTDNVLATLDRMGDGEKRTIEGNAAVNNFGDKISRTRAVLDQYGFESIPIEVSEGGLVYGTDGKWLWHGLAFGGSFDASWTALSFKKMLDNQVVLWSRWPISRSSGLFRGPELAATNAIRLIDRMSEDRRIHVQGTGTATSEIVASLSSDEKTVRILAFNHAPNFNNPNPTETLKLDLSKLPFDGKVSTTIWRVDENHADFWPKWETDRAAYGINDSDYYQSMDQPDPAHALLKSEHIAYWHSREAAYEKLAELDVASIRYDRVEKGQLNMELKLPCYAVALVEICEER